MQVTAISNTLRVIENYCDVFWSSPCFFSTRLINFPNLKLFFDYLDKPRNIKLGLWNKNPSRGMIMYFYTIHSTRISWVSEYQNLAIQIPNSFILIGLQLSWRIQSEKKSFWWTETARNLLGQKDIRSNSETNNVKHPYLIESLT